MKINSKQRKRLEYTNFWRWITNAHPLDKLHYTCQRPPWTFTWYMSSSFNLAFTLQIVCKLPFTQTKEIDGHFLLGLKRRLQFIVQNKKSKCFSCETNQPKSSLSITTFVLHMHKSWHKGMVEVCNVWKPT